MLANSYMPCMNSTSAQTSRQGPTDNFRNVRPFSSLPISPPSSEHRHLPQPITLPSPPPAAATVPGYSILTPPSHTPCFRYDTVLHAPPSVGQRETLQLTYLNKNQYYCIRIHDTEGYDGPLTSTLTLTFHEETHRRLAANYWRFWASQQKNPSTTRALDINHSRSSGIYRVQYPDFDRITFEWNGKQGATIHVRFNCLSTDFSRIKGVKGIPLRLHMESRSDHQQHVESTFCRVKLFRDKGAERKNKDDIRHMERMRGSDPQPMRPEYGHSVQQPYTVFSEAAEPLVDSPAACHHGSSKGSHGHMMEDDSVPLRPRKRAGSTVSSPYPYDPIRQIRHRTGRLAIYARLVSSDLYHGIYLDDLTVHELVRKMSVKMLLSMPIKDVIRYLPGKAIAVQMDDCMIRDIRDEQDMKVEYKPQSDGSALLILHY